MATKKAAVYTSQELSKTALQKAIKDSVLPFVLDGGINSTECTQIDNYTWILHTEIAGEPFYAKLALTACAPDYSMDKLASEVGEYEAKMQRAVDRETSRAQKAVEKANAVPRNSSGNLTSDMRSYDERYAADDF